MIREFDPGNILSAIERIQPQAVCFDYFDTLVARSVHPEDMKRIWAESLARIFPVWLNGSELYQRRSEMEAAQCARSRGPALGSEFRAVDIYAELWKKNSALHELEQEKFVRLALDLEISLELANQHIDGPMANLARKLSASGLECWLASDFYLGSEAFQVFLARHGLHDVFTRLFVSSDSFATKRGNGSLYARILADTGISPDRIVMIGDNEHADSINAKAAGLHAFHIDRSRQHARYAELASQSNDTGAALSAIGRVFEASNAVFKELSLTLFAFIDSLYAKLLRDGAKDVFFLAREGQFLKKLFDHYQQIRRLQGAAYIRSHYLEVSRRSTLLPSLLSLHEETFETLFRQYRRISVLDFLLSLGLDDVAPKLTIRLGINVDAIEDDLPTSASFKRLLDDELFQLTYEHERTVRREAFLDYIRSFAPDTSQHTIHLVDVGWKGTIQDNIYRTLASSRSGFNIVKGYYIGLVACGAASAANLKQGLIYSCVNGVSKNFHIYNENRALFEVVLAADHGSALSYARGVDGDVRVLRQDFFEEMLFHSKIEPLQQTLFELFKQIEHLFRHRVFSEQDLRRLTTRMHARMLLQPTTAEVEWFENVYHVENFGIFTRSTFGTSAQRPSLINKVRFYLALRRQRNSDHLGFWPMLTCLQQGGRWVASRYAAARLHNIED